MRWKYYKLQKDGTWQAGNSQVLSSSHSTRWQEHYVRQSQSHKHCTNTEFGNLSAWNIAQKEQCIKRDARKRKQHFSNSSIQCPSHTFHHKLFAVSSSVQYNVLQHLRHSLFTVSSSVQPVFPHLTRSTVSFLQFPPAYNLSFHTSHVKLLTLPSTEG